MNIMTVGNFIKLGRNLRGPRRPAPLEVRVDAALGAAAAFSNVAVRTMSEHPDIVSRIIRWHGVDFFDGILFPTVVLLVSRQSENKNMVRAVAASFVVGGAAWEGLQSATVGKNDTDTTFQKMPETLPHFTQTFGTHPYDFGDASAYLCGAVAFLTVRKAIINGLNKWRAKHPPKNALG